MYSLNRLIYGNTIKTNENLHAYEGRRVIITILDETVEDPNQLVNNTLDLKRKDAARKLAGMWETGQNEETVDDIVGNLRKGRSFDI